jgi:hypothetical protein
LKVNNLPATRSVLAIRENDASWQANRLMSMDQYYFQPGNLPRERRSASSGARQE